MNRVWSQEQKNAIYDDKGTLLVSAAAGSGKTAVLVERIIERITNKEKPVDADKLLVVTFSVAAANEMKERIIKRLTELIKKTPDNSFLIKQQMLINKAQISTIHSFCLDIIRKNFHLLDISPNFRIGDEKEIEVIMYDTLKEVLEDYYVKGDDEFNNLVELLMVGKDDKNLVQTILTLYKFIRSHPFYNDWLDKKLLMYNDKINVCDTMWGQVILSYAKDATEYALNINNKAIKIIEYDDVLTEKLKDTFYDDHDKIDVLCGKIKDGRWDDIVLALDNISFSRFPTIRGYADSYKKNVVKNSRDSVKKIIESLKEKLFCSSEGEFKEDIMDLQPKIKVLFEITQEFDKRVTEKKKKRKMLDFSDIEHLSLSLLTEKDGEEVNKTALAQSLCDFFEMVVIDEYQDTNETQEMIFKSVSKTNNVFMVGDVKQSIYRFRQAMPEIFLRKKELYSEYDGQNYPAKIIFNKNFRSRKEVTDSINFIFEMIMSKDMGEIDYEGEERLFPKAQYPTSDEMKTEVHIINHVNKNDDATQGEATYVAKQIAKLINSDFQISDGDKLRKIEAKDICILMRSPKNKAQTYLKALANEGIAGWSDAQSGYLESTEISTVMSILRTINNPLSDISVVGAMMSPVFMFTADEIAQIKINAKDRNVYLACTQMADSGDAHCKDFVEKIQDMRKYSATLSADDTIRKILDITDLREIICTMKRSETRLANIRLLINYANTYEKSGYKGIGGFVRFVNNIMEKGMDFDSAITISQTADVVKIMSIHKSKGLEFPVVFLCDTSKGFNKQDIHTNTVLHSELGFACSRRDQKTRKQFSTVPLEATKLELERSMLSEELRILYVALTRAKEKLFITSSQNDVAKKLNSLNCKLTQKGTLSSYNVRDASSYADWILMALIHNCDMKSVLGTLGIEAQTTQKIEVPIETFKIIQDNDNFDCEEEQEENTNKYEKNENLYQEIKTKISNEYIYKNAVTIPSKISVSQIIGKDKGDKRFSYTPKFVTHEKLTSAQKGSAFHAYMLYANHKDAKDDIENEFKRLAQDKFLTQKQLDCIDKNAVMRFYETSLYNRMENADWCKREMRFMTDFGKEKLLDIIENIGDNKVTVQGISDIVFEENGELVVADYKTDNTNDIDEFIKRYKKQLIIYSEILEKLTGKKVKERIIYSVKHNKEIWV